MGMGAGPCYWQRGAMKAALSIPDTDDDVAFDTAIVTASRSIDLTCQRDFATLFATRYVTAARATDILVDDLLSVTELRTDFGGRSYDVLWDTTDYDLEPSDNPLESLPLPYWQICTTPLGKQTFTPGLRRGVKIIGEWGFYKVLQALTGVVGGTGLTNSATTLTMVSTAELDVGHTLAIETEQLFVSAVLNVTTATVIRGVNGTTAAAHAASTPIAIFTYPVVEKACQILATRLFRRRDTPYGIVGTATMGDMRLALNDPDVMNLIGPLTKRVGG